MARGRLHSFYERAGGGEGCAAFRAGHGSTGNRDGNAVRQVAAASPVVVPESLRRPIELSDLCSMVAAGFSQAGTGEGGGEEITIAYTQAWTRYARSIIIPWECHVRNSGMRIKLQGALAALSVCLSWLEV